MSPTTASTATVDGLDPVSFEINYLPGVRGIFDDLLWYQYFPLLERDFKDFDNPHRIPVMLGCAFAIRRDFFYDLGQYDEGNDH